MSDHSHNPILALKEACHDACHERHACTHGYKELMDSKTVEEIATVLRRYWQELVSKQYADVICEEMPYHYEELKDGFNKAGVYFNECPQGVMQQAFVLIGNSDKPVHIYGNSSAYVLGKVHVIGHDQSRLYCDQSDGKIELLDYAKGVLTAGYAIVRNRAQLDASADCECHNAATVLITAGTLTDHGHMQISAYKDAVVNSFTNRKIALYNNAKLTIR